MKTLKLFRTFNEGFQNFRRDKWLTTVTVLVMSLALYLMGVAFFSSYGILNVLNNVQDQVNISMNFDFDIPENEILEIKKEIEKIKEVKSVIYLSREENLEKVKNFFGNDKKFTESLEKIGNNPMPASLIIISDNVENYAKLNEVLTSKYKEKLLNENETNFDKNKDNMKYTHDFISFIRNVSLSFGIIMIFISILLNLNTIRMSLYANRKEFEIMRLVGASNLYIKLPTIFEGFLYGLVSSVITIIGLIVTIFATRSFIKNALGNVEIMDFYTKHIIEIIFFIILTGIIIGTFSSYIAIRKYLEK